jgi:hypothetical protein
MRCDHFDAIAFGQISVQAVTVIGFVTDQSRREVVEEGVSEDAFDELAFARRVGYFCAFCESLNRVFSSWRELFFAHLRV